MVVGCRLMVVTKYYSLFTNHFPQVNPKSNIVNKLKSVEASFSMDFLFRILNETHRILIGKVLLVFDYLTLK